MIAPNIHFPSPDSTTAPRPPEARGLARDGVRLMVATGESTAHARFRDLPSYVETGDLLVVNNSGTLAAELDAHWRGAPIVVHVATRLDNGHWVIELRSAPDAAEPVLDAEAGDTVDLPAGARLDLLAPYPRENSSPTGHGNRLWQVALIGEASLTNLMALFGRPIAYGYLDKRYPLPAYQTVFGIRPGSAEMASAARPFTTELVTRLISSGVGIVPITLHTGVSSQDAGEFPQAEPFDVPRSTAQAINRTRANGRRVIAVGTTATRAVESAVTADNVVVARSDWTERIVTPADPPRIVDGLITGWHNPEASHLLLVEAVAGRELTQRAYDAAIAHEYLWHEFGDSALLLPR
ncbi:S-adenosylmethionine:tRNA ribosyltransferase-isomerase [Antricoccus suffuscus]|uniref:S-adenosylmethionine:tRNA ribosyltransferase-isomerase n=1 Tax=Antricoccus suffuscus TaxID=1629062 RepID=A0A2T0ZZ63_9ACTN|nr:S-adenosylmethionine:tRNA ribosyltransferase-isomerase [Antricoccus suffuscus]PRZ41645.1 S-adenosylmethionine:tRNA ribosyltransferase-isomerase [Antricoccus suffuscus]